MRAVDMVAEFHQKFDLPNLVGQPSIIAEDRIEFRYELIREEIEELRVALEAHDQVEIADALADIVYVVVGAALEFGISFEGIDFRARVTTPTLAMMEVWQQILRDSLDTRDVAGTSVALVRIAQIAYGMARHRGIPLQAVLEEVHRSNMTKVWADGTVHKREDGKVLKPPTYSPADIVSVLAYDAVEEPLCTCDSTDHPCEVHDT